MYKEDVVEIPPEFTARIMANGREVRVTQNLLDALTSLRDAWVFGLLGVDALCLNLGLYRAKYPRNLRAGPLFSEGLRSIA